MKEKHIKIYFSAILLLSVLFHLASCYITKYRFLHNTSEIVSIEIVENRYTIEDSLSKDYQNVLVTIESTDSFLNEFQSIPYTMPLYNGMVLSFRDSELGIKFTYSNGDYEILSSGAYNLVYRSESEYHYAVSDIIGFFDDEEFNNLVAKYLDQCENPKFYIMHDQNNISSIEVVDAYMCKNEDGELELSYSTVTNLEDTADFLSELGSLNYRYTLQKLGNSQVFDNNEHRDAIKITYRNGDYEIFGSDWRHMYTSETDTCIDNAYIGEFDEVEFNNFISNVSKSE